MLIHTISKNTCKTFNCVQCCKETEMFLSNEDINRIEKYGFSRDLFVDDVDGWLRLKNKNGYCVFHDGKNCLIYPKRPEGCKLYPVIYDADNDCAIIDTDCPHCTYFSITKECKKRLFSLVSRIESEQKL
ncbi:MAG: YkgJ family cysteine cluster protein [Candidatus Thermoplasmatota archaeon]|nr:YkgJ family cysteine cluster protein [Candidatus Thermoplasmatota archaeon]